MSEFVETIQAVRGAIREDYGESTLADRARMIGSAALWPVHEIGMETALAAVGTHTLEYTHNALAVGAAMGSLSLGVETTLAYLIAHNMESFRGAISTIRERYYPSEGAAEKPAAEVVAEESTKTKIAQAIDTGSLALSLGSPGVMIRDFSRDPDRSYEDNKRTGLKAGRSLAAFNLVLGTVLAGSGWVAEKLGTNAVTDAVIDVGKSPITYASILSIVVGPRAYSIHRSRIERRRAAAAAEADAETPDMLPAEDLPMSKTVTSERLQVFVAEHAKHQYQTPFMLTNLDALKERSREFRKQFPRVGIYYAVKCFADEQVVRALDAYVDGYDVASIEEVKATLKLGVDPLRLAFSNPIKSDQALRDAHKLGVKRFAYQNYDELVKIKRYIPDAEVYLRVQVADAASELSFSSKFGAKPAQALELFQQAVTLGLKPTGLTFHVGSQATANKVWPNAIAISAKLMAEAKAAGIRLHMVNLGGGFPVQYSPSQPTLASVASVINTSLTKNFPAKKPQLMAEPGRYLVADSSVIITTIIGMEKRGNANWLYLDIGAFQAFIEIFEFGYFPYPVYSLQQLKDGVKPPATKQYVLSGPSCDSFDTMTRSITLPADLHVGDRLVIDMAGAYTVVYGSNFNGFNVPPRHFFTGKGA